MIHIVKGFSVVNEAEADVFLEFPCFLCGPMDVGNLISGSSPAAAAAQLLQSCPTLCNPIDGSPPGSLSLGFSRQEYWSGLPFPSPMHESEKWKWIVQSCPTLNDPMDCSMPGFTVLHYLLEFAQTHVHWVDDAIQPSHSLLPPSPPALDLSIYIYSLRFFFLIVITECWV